MLLDVCFGTRSVWKLLLVLAEAPGKAISRGEIKSLTKLGNKVLVSSLLILERFDIIKEDKIGKRYYYKMNLANPFTDYLIEIIRLEKNELNNPDFFIMSLLREFVYELINICSDNLCKVILFGSYAKRTFVHNSDVDVAVVLKENNSDEEIMIAESTNRISKRFKKEIQVHYFTIDEFDKEKKRKGIINEIYKDGIVLI